MVVDQLFDSLQHSIITLPFALFSEAFGDETAALWNNPVEKDALFDRFECFPVEIEDLELPEAVVQGGAIGDQLVDPLNVFVVDLVIKAIEFCLRNWAHGYVHQRFKAHPEFEEPADEHPPVGVHFEIALDHQL